VANGAPAESYRDDGNRWLFRNANAAWDAPAPPPCAPILTGGEVVDAVWRRLLDRSGPRTPVPLTADPDLHLIVDGSRIDARSRHGSAYIFSLPCPHSEVRIVSRAASPQELGLMRDPRCLGVALRRITVQQGARLAVIDANDEGLASGYHGFEPAEHFRWTDGDACLPLALFDGLAGSVEVVLHIAGTTQYLDEGERVLAA